VARVSATGSPRYDHITVPEVGASPPLPDAAHPARVILIAASIAADVELDMIEALGNAISGDSAVRVILRNHPFRRLEAEARFALFRERIEVSSASLDDDLRDADVVLFSYSTVAEEAFLRGVPVWQWLPPGFNGSALAEVACVPAFSTIEGLRAALRAGLTAPTREEQVSVARALFGPCDGRAAERVAGAIARGGFEP
jgi:hypothetical protein